MNRTQELEHIIKVLDTLYEIGEDCVHPITGEIVSNGEYDALRRELAQLSPNSKIFSNPTASKVKTAKKMVHKPPMTSISKASHEDREVQKQQLSKWLANTNSNNYCQAYKLDGVALGLDYEHGRLVVAGLRPQDGINGEDVTEQVKYVNGIPENLNIPLTCSIRGELICKLSDFEKVQKSLIAAGQDVRSNPRNHTAGGIRQFKEPAKVKDMRLSFMAYSIEGLDNPPYKTEIERAEYSNQVLGVPFVQISPFKYEDLQTMEDNVKNLDYEVDGVVIGVNNLEDQEQLGRHGDSATGNPKGKIAWKFAEERATPVIKDIEWKTGRTGAIKPVAVFDAVPLAGTQVRRATLHNLGFIYRNKIQIGTKIIVLKAGKIIPKVVGVVSEEANYNNIFDVATGSICPSCGKKAEIKRNDEMYELICVNKSDCPAQSISGLVHYLKTFGVLGLGEATVTALVDNNIIRTPACFYSLTVNKMMKADISEREALLALAGIYLISSPEKYENDELDKLIEKTRKNKIQVPAWKLFAALGIESAGKSAGKALMEHFGSFDQIMAATDEELAAVEGVGIKTAMVINDYLTGHAPMIKELLNFIEPEKLKSGPLTGRTFVLTGSFDLGKRHWQEQIESQGGKCTSSVSKTTNYVVEGVDAGSKADKAKALGIPLISVEKLKSILNL